MTVVEMPNSTRPVDQVKILLDASGMDIWISSHFFLLPGSPVGALPSSWVRWPARGGPTNCEWAALSTGKVAHSMKGRKHLPGPRALLETTVTAAFPVSCRMDCLSAKRRPVDRCAGFPLPVLAQLTTASESELRRLLACQDGTPRDKDQPTVPTTAFASADTNPSLTAWWRAPWRFDPARPNATLIDIAARGRGCGCPGTSRPSGCFKERPLDACSAPNDSALMTADRRPSAGSVAGYAAHGMPQTGGYCRSAKWPPAVGSVGGSSGDGRNACSTCRVLGTETPSQRLADRVNSFNLVSGLAGGPPRRMEEKDKQDGSRIRDRFAARRRTFSQLRGAR